MSCKESRGVESGDRVRVLKMGCWAILAAGLWNFGGSVSFIIRVIAMDCSELNRIHSLNGFICQVNFLLVVSGDVGAESSKLKAESSRQVQRRLRVQGNKGPRYTVHGPGKGLKLLFGRSIDFLLKSMLFLLQM